MGYSKIKKWEAAVVMLLNFDGWQLKCPEDEYSIYDAIGKTPKGFDCVIEMKFRNTYYADKMLEKEKYESLMALDNNIVKIYFVNDLKGNYMYWLNNLKMPETIKKYCPDTTMWTRKQLLKEVFLLKENQASRINLTKS